MTMTKRHITLTEALRRLAEIRDLVGQQDTEAAEEEQQELMVDVLRTIADAPTIADKRELKKLAAVAVEGLEVRVK